MTPKLLATTVIPLMFATMTMAQTDMAGGSMTGHSWSDAAAETFFTNDGSMAMRTEAEIRADWNALSEQDRAMVRADCAAMPMTADASTPEADTAGTEQGTGATTTTATAVGVGQVDTGTAGTVTGDTGTAGTEAMTGATTGDGATTGTDTAGTVTADTGTTGTERMTGATTGMAGTGPVMQGITGGQVSQGTWIELCSVVGGL